MKLVAYDIGTGPRAGVVVNERIVDVTALLRLRTPLSDVRALLELPDTPIERVRQALASGANAPSVPLADVRLLSPVLRPPTVRDFFDFEAHAARGARARGQQLNEAWYRLPIFYFSNPLCMIGPDADVLYPEAARTFDYELELAAVIGREGSNISEADGLSCIAGFTILIDWSARDLQRDESQVGLGPAKGKDCGTSLGPWVVTTDELQPYLRDGRLHVRCTLTVNDEQWMEGAGGSMQHTWGAFVERASKDSRIAAGDVFGSGTVGGGSIGEAIANGYKNARYLQPGDVVEMTVEGIGVLRNTIVPPLAANPDYPYRAPSAN